MMSIRVVFDLIFSTFYHFLYPMGWCEVVQTLLARLGSP